MVTDVIVVVVGTGRVNAAPSELHVWLTQGGVSRGWKIGLAAAALWVVRLWFAFDTKPRWTRRSRVYGWYIASLG